MAAPGTYLSSFVESFLRSRGLEEQRSRGEAQDVGDIFRVQRYLDELGREREAETTIAGMLRRPSYPQNASVIPSAPPTWRGDASLYEGLPNPAPPPIPSVAAGGATALQHGPIPGAGPAPNAGMAMPSRPPALTSVLQGVAPEAAARLFTTQAGRAALPSLENAERERRKEEDRAQAEALFGKAQDAFKRHEPAEAADFMAAGYRRIGAHDQAGRMMEYGAKVRTDADEREKAKKDFAAITTATAAHDADPSPGNLAKVHEALAGAESLVGRGFAMEITKVRLQKALSPDRDIDAFLRHATMRTIGPNRVPVERAWEEAMQKYPSGFAKLWQQDIMNPEKTRLPEFVWGLLKMEPPGPKKDQTLSQRAWIIARQDAQKREITDPAQFTRLWQEWINELTTQEATAKRPPEEAERSKLRLEMDRLRLAAMKNPDALNVKDLTLLIQRIGAQLRSGDLDPADEAVMRENERFFIGKLKEAKERLGGGAKTEPAPADKKAQAEQIMTRLFPGKRWDQLTAAEKKRVADQVK